MLQLCFSLQLEVLRIELQRAEIELEDRCWIAPPVLQHWLQITYELETQVRGIDSASVLKKKIHLKIFIRSYQVGFRVESQSPIFRPVNSIARKVFATKKLP